MVNLSKLFVIIFIISLVACEKAPQPVSNNDNHITVDSSFVITDPKIIAFDDLKDLKSISFSIENGFELEGETGYGPALGAPNSQTITDNIFLNHSMTFNNITFYNSYKTTKDSCYATFTDSTIVFVIYSDSYLTNTLKLNYNKTNNEITKIYFQNLYSYYSSNLTDPNHDGRHLYGTVKSDTRQYSFTIANNNLRILKENQKYILEGNNFIQNVISAYKSKTSYTQNYDGNPMGGNYSYGMYEGLNRIKNPRPNARFTINMNFK